jgi:hypothetical protein
MDLENAARFCEPLDLLRTAEGPIPSRFGRHTRSTWGRAAPLLLETMVGQTPKIDETGECPNGDANDSDGSDSDGEDT